MDFENKISELAGVKEFLDDYIEKIFNTNDFSLVDLSHEDSCWINHFEVGNMYHNEEIPAKDIVKEYAARM